MKEFRFLSINAITFGFSVPVSEQETPFGHWEKVSSSIGSEEYIILSYDNSEGQKLK